MNPTISFGVIARQCAKHSRIVLAGWLIGLALLVAAGVTVGGELSDSDEFITNPESEQAYALLGQRWDRQGEDEYSELVIIRSQHRTVDDPVFRQTIESIANQLRGANGDLGVATTYFEALDSADERAALLVSPDRRSTLIPMQPWFGAGSSEQRVRAIAEQSPGFEVLLVSEQRFDDEMDRLIESDLIRSEMIGIPAALIILVIVFGALVAAGIPILLAVIAILGATMLSLLLASVTDVSIYALNMISMIGLAVGVDYALIVIDRYREERRSGLDSLDAIERAGNTASRAVVFSGVTVAISLVGMFLLPTTLFRSLATGAILAVLVAVLATLTLVPAILKLVGNRLDWPRRSNAGHAGASPESTSHAAGQSFWDRVANLVMARPAASALLAAGLLLALALPFTSMEEGTAGIESMPPGDLRRGYQIMSQDFAAGMIEPVMIVVDTVQRPEADRAVTQLTEALGQDEAFGPVTNQQWNHSGDLALIEVPLAVDGNSPQGYDAIDRLRDTHIPVAFAQVDGRVLVTGEVAENADFNNLVDRWTPRVLALVLSLSFVVLLLAFRSLVVPIKAILLNLLSVAAAYGVLVLVFQEGHGAGLLGFQRTATIEAWVPIFLFCILFGLSMDYHIFLLSRIREHFDRSGDNQASVAAGLRSTARIITGVAAIMVAVFLAFASADLVMFQQLGFGLAIAIFLDATIVRMVLVPASMTLLGNWNWYLPGWLNWLPRLTIETSDEPTDSPLTESAPAD